MPQATSNNKANSVLVFHLHKIVKMKNVFNVNSMKIIKRESTDYRKLFRG